MANTVRRPSNLHETALICGVAITVAVMLLVKQFAPRPTSAAVAVVFPPWTGGAEAIEAAVVAGASILRPGPYPFVVVVRPTVAGYATRAFAAGAWLVVDARNSGGCSAGRGTRS